MSVYQGTHIYVIIYIGMYTYQVFLQLLLQRFIVNASNFFKMKSIFLYNSCFKIFSDFKTLVM